MDGKKSSLVSSTPHPTRSRQVLSLFENIELTPISEPLQFKDPLGCQAMPKSSKPSGPLQTGAVRKRRIASKEKAAPESVTAGVLKELGVEAQDLGSNLLSHSRNLYNMFPEPIILDSDNEEDNSIIAKKRMKKPKQDSKVAQCSSTKNQEEKKIKELVPGNRRRITRLTRPIADRKLKKQTNAQSLKSIPSSSKDLKTTLKSKSQIQNKPSSYHEDTVVLVDDEDSLFPVYQPGTSVHRTTSKKKLKVNDRLSLELDEMFPIEWSQRRQKPEVNKAEHILDKNNKIHQSNLVEKNNNKKGTTKHSGLNKVPDVDCVEVPDVDVPDFYGVEVPNVDGVDRISDVENIKIHGIENNNNLKETSTQSKKSVTNVKNKTKVLTRVETKCRSDKNVGNKEDCIINREKDCSALISHFDDITFKPSTTFGGIIARSLKTDQNDFGYLEVSASETFNGQSKNITFVLIEGKAKVLHVGREHNLLPGDMIHIRDDSGYQFESAGTEHVRFLYIKPH